MRPSFNPLNSIMSGIRLSLSLSWCCCGNWWALDSCRTTLPWQRSQPTPMHMCVNVCVCVCCFFVFFAVLLYEWGAICCHQPGIMGAGSWNNPDAYAHLPSSKNKSFFFFSFLSPHKTCGKTSDLSDLSKQVLGLLCCHCSYCQSGRSTDAVTRLTSVFSRRPSGVWAQSELTYCSYSRF